MQNLIDFFEKETNRKIKLIKYDNEDLKDNQSLVSFNDISYTIEFISNEDLSNISGYTYLFYQHDLDFNSLENILNNLYEDVNIVHYDKYLLLVSKHILDISDSSPNIIESETYRKTYIVYLNNVQNKNDLKFNIDIVNELLPIVIKNNTSNKILNLNDLIIYKTIFLCNEDNFLNRLVDFDTIKTMDDSLLITGINFIENGLNISKTSNSLFLHRNTLVYRLDKIKEVLNLDLKNFKDALVFYLSVKSYLYF